MSRAYWSRPMSKYYVKRKDSQHSYLSNLTLFNWGEHYIVEEIGWYNKASAYVFDSLDEAMRVSSIINKNILGNKQEFTYIAEIINEEEYNGNRTTNFF